MKKLTRLLMTKLHRKQQYERAMQLFIDGKVPRSYVEERYKKWKEVKDK